MISRRRSLNRRARAALLWGAGCLVAIQFLVGLALDYRWPFVRFPSAGLVIGGFDQLSWKPDVVCLGSSRFIAGIQASEIGEAVKQQVPGQPAPRVFNAAVPAGDLISAEFLFKRLLDHGLQPRLAVIEVNPETLNHYNEWFFFHVRRQLCWSDVPAYLPDVCRSHQLRRLLQARLNPVFVQRRQIQHALFSWINGDTASPWAIEGQCRGSGSQLPEESKRKGTPISWEEVICKGTHAPDARQLECTQDGVGQAYRWLKHYRIGGASVASLDRILQCCREHGIEPILVAVPVTKAHREAYTPAIEASYREHMAGISRKYACRFLDYRDQVPDALFIDNHHLIPQEGGRVFSRRLAEDVVAPAWRR